MTSYVWGDAVVNGVIHAISDADTMQARADARSAYNTIAALGFDTNLTGQDLGGGRVLTPGVYHFDTSAQLTGTLTLDGLGQTNPEFIFQIGSTLTTAPYSTIYAINGAVDWNVFFQVGTSATLYTYTTFIGTILADQSITLNTGATVLNGGLFALEGAVVLDNNRIDAVPEPAQAALVIAGLALIAIVRKRFKPGNVHD
jgi:type VI secretion system secreted protein VgrG